MRTVALLWIWVAVVILSFVARDGVIELKRIATAMETCRK